MQMIAHGESDPWAQGSLHAIRIAGNDGKIGSGRLIGLSAALFPVSQRAQRDTTSLRELFLGQPKRPADALGPRGALHPIAVRCGQRLRVRV